MTSVSYILPKCAKTTEPKDEHCIPLVHPYQLTYNMTLYP